MKVITKEILKKHAINDDLYIEVLEKYGNCFSISYDQLLLDFPMYRIWIIKNLFEYKIKLCPLYKGKLKIDQIIYRQQYTIGHYIKSKIATIELSRDMSEYCCMVNTNEPTEFDDIHYNFISEKDLFVTLNKLKEKWHEMIEDINE